MRSPEDRAAAGKPEAGQISIAAFYESAQVLIEIADDGRGLDADRIRAMAVERGLVSAEAIARLSDEEIYRFILEPGFSTAKEVTKVSGRGVGMDVVRSNIEAIGGTISLQSTRGRGSKFTLKIPLTLAIAPALVVSVGPQRFAIPQHCVVEAVSVEEDTNNLQTIQNALVLRLRDELIPVAELARILELPSADVVSDRLVVVLGLRGKKFAIVVDEIAGIQEIVVQPLGPLFSSLKVFSGNTVLGDGSIVLIIDPAGIADAMAVELSSESVLAHKGEQEVITGSSSLILFRAGSGAAKVLPRSAILRIVRAQKNAIFQADGLYLYRYQNKLIPILRVAGSGWKADSCLILVASLHDRIFGLWVDEVLDIVESSGEIQLASNSSSVIGTMDLNGAAVEFIDTAYYCHAAYEAAHRYSNSGQTSLLIVDAEPGTHDMLSSLLASAGHKVTAVQTVEQANKLLQQMDFGVILLNSKSRACLDEAALSRQPNALCLVFDEGNQGAGDETSSADVILSRFDRHRILSVIAHHLDAQPAEGPPAANLNHAPSEQTVRFG